MSVVFTTISENFIALCADKQRINAVTGKVIDDMTKIEKWAPQLAVGVSGNLALGELVRTTVHQFVTESGISNFGVEEIADLFIQSYQNTLANHNTPEDIISKFIIAGKLANKKLGAVVIRVGADTADKETFEASKVPATLILEPADLSSEQCNMLLAKALKNVEGKYLKNPLESIHRRAVRNVSEHSQYVSKDSDFLLITP